MKEKINWLSNYFQKSIEALFNPDKEKEFPWLKWAWLGALYLVGIFLFGDFLNLGEISFDFLDWAEISAARLAFLRDAVLKGVLPLHMPDATALHGVSDRFMSIPDVILSPQIILMRFMEIGPFVFINTLLLYSIGTLGLLRLRRKLSLSLVAFSVLFFLFNFNGHILTHLAVGHVSWGAYFLFPWFVLLLFDLIEGDKSWRWVLLTSLLLFFTFLQGSFHHFVWMVIFLGLVGITSWKYFSQILKAIVFSLLMSMVRILPIALGMGKFPREFKSGYTTVTHVLTAMTSMKPPWEAIYRDLPFTPISWWEFDLFIGLIGTAFVLYFGLYRWIRNHREKNTFPELLLPITAMFALTIGHIYYPIFISPLVLLSGERVSSRMIIIPFVFLLVLGANELQRWIKQSKPKVTVRITQLVLLVLMVNDLWFYVRLWGVANIAFNFDDLAVDLSIKVIANHPDPPYISMLIIGSAITLITFAFLFFMARREKQKISSSKSVQE